MAVFSLEWYSQCWALELGRRVLPASPNSFIHVSAPPHIPCIYMIQSDIFAVEVATLLLTVLGFVVGLSLSFRSSTAYERYIPSSINLSSQNPNVDLDTPKVARRGAHS